MLTVLTIIFCNKREKKSNANICEDSALFYLKFPAWLNNQDGDPFLYSKQLFFFCLGLIAIQLTHHIVYLSGVQWGELIQEYVPTVGGNAK